MERTKTALITGATAGIGQASAQIFAKNGWNLIITGRRNERLQSLKTELESQYKMAVLPLCFDICSYSQTETALQSMSDEWKHIDLVVNNAGLAVGRDAFQDANVEDWERMIDTNIKGLLYVSRLASAMMIERGIKGHFIHLSSIAAYQVYPGGHVYCATKHAVDAISKSMRIDLLKHGIRVTSINPGAVETEFSIVRFKGNVEQAAKVYDGYKPLVAEDIADAIWYVATRPSHVCINEIQLTCTAQANVNHIVKNKT